MRKKYPRQQPKPHVNTYAQQEEFEEVVDDQQTERSGWRMRFGTRGLLMLMLISSVLFAGGGYLLHAVRASVNIRGRFQLTFILFTLVAPIALLISFSIVAWILRIPIRDRDADEPDEL